MHFLLVSGKGSTLSNAIQRYPSLSQTLEKFQNLEKSIFCCFAGGRKTWKNCKTWKNVFFYFPGRLQHYPTLSVLILDPRKIAKLGKMHFFTGSREGQNLKNCKTWKNAFFAALREGPNAIKRYPSLSQTLEKLQNLEKCMFCWFPGRPQRYPTLSVLIPDPRKIAKPGKCIFCWFAGGTKLGKIAKPGKMYFLLVCRTALALSNAIRHYPKP